jgi:hypothetical protein
MTTAPIASRIDRRSGRFPELSNGVQVGDKQWLAADIGDRQHTEGCTSYQRLTARRCIMKAGIFFTGTGPILLLTSYETLNDPRLIEKLYTKGIKKFIAYEVPENKVMQRYGKHYNVILGDLRQTDDLRILDYDGHHVFLNFSLHELGESFLHDGGN